MFGPTGHHAPLYVRVFRIWAIQPYGIPSPVFGLAVLWGTIPGVRVYWPCSCITVFGTGAVHPFLYVCIRDLGYAALLVYVQDWDRGHALAFIKMVELYNTNFGYRARESGAMIPLLDI